MPAYDSRRASYIIPPVKPLEYEYSPPPSPVRASLKISRPATSPGGGPLSAHPPNESTPFPSLPGAFPLSPPDSTTNMSSESHRNTTESSVRSPTSSGLPQSPQRERRPSSVRRLFSITSLRQSFSSSRTSFTQPPGSAYGNQSFGEQSRSATPVVPSMSAAASMTADTNPYSPRSGNKLRKKRDSTWFRRRSGFFNIGEDGMLESVDEDHVNKRFKPHTLPMLPEIESLGGGRLDAGDLGWDEQAFKS